MTIITDIRAVTGRPAGPLSPASLKDGRKAGPQHEKGFAQDTAEKTGLSKRSINQSLRRANNIDAEVQEQIKGTNIAKKGVELDALADMTPAEQKMVVEMVKAGKAASVREASEAIALRPQKKKRRGRNQAQERAHLWRKFKEALENLNGMQDVEHIAGTVPASQRAMVAWKLAIVRGWLVDFQSEWTRKHKASAKRFADRSAGIKKLPACAVRRNLQSCAPRHRLARGARLDNRRCWQSRCCRRRSRSRRRNSLLTMPANGCRLALLAGRPRS